MSYLELELFKFLWVIIIKYKEKLKVAFYKTIFELKL